jgi:hypothetical protein
MDSLYHGRKKGNFQFEDSEDVYFPLEHASFMKDQFPLLGKGERTLHGMPLCLSIVEMFMKKATWPVLLQNN